MAFLWSLRLVFFLLIATILGSASGLLTFSLNTRRDLHRIQIATCILSRFSNGSKRGWLFLVVVLHFCTEILSSWRHLGVGPVETHQSL